jgi:2-amino-4-hydroxy-6-hydroxymethyldihydropteridine diphosphokinase
MILVGLGSNIGNREENILTAVCQLQRQDGISIERVSSIYETEPVGFTEQPAFLNAAVELKSRLDPFQLMEICLQIERNMGRIRDRRWGPRIIDIDLLIYHQRRIAAQFLQLPHPRIGQRRFVLIPLNEIAAEEPVVMGLTPGKLLELTEDRSAVHLYGSIDFPQNINFVEDTKQ